MAIAVDRAKRLLVHHQSSFRISPYELSDDGPPNKYCRYMRVRICTRLSIILHLLHKLMIHKMYVLNILSCRLCPPNKYCRCLLCTYLHSAFDNLTLHKIMIHNVLMLILNICRACYVIGRCNCYFLVMHVVRFE